MPPPLHSPLPPFGAWSGPRNPRILFVGEAFGGGEAELRLPFVGEAGKELWRLLEPFGFQALLSEITALHRYGLAWVKRREAWLEQASIALTNVFNLRPEGNDVSTLFWSKKESDAAGGYPPDLPPFHQPKAPGKTHVRPEYLPELSRLHLEIEQSRPNLIVAFGNTACWALLHTANISSIRGTVAQSPHLGVKVLPTYHPAAILRNWAWRPILQADLMKAAQEGTFPEFKRPWREVLISPTLDEAEWWVHETTLFPPPFLACDIETACGQIKCVGFARSRANALVIPFFDPSLLTWSYWPSPEAERVAWSLVERLLASPIPKLFQNGMYDLQYLLRLGLTIRGISHDTMLLHHSLFPELQKGLGFLGSIYTNEASWKLMRRHKADTEKRDE